MEEHIEDDNEEVEDLSNIPLFESCEEIERKHQAFFSLQLHSQRVIQHC